MNYKELKNQVKENQKQLANEIKRGKFLSHPKNWHLMTDEEKKIYIYKTNYQGRIIESFMFWKVDNLSKEYRTNHITYCTFFNKTPYEKIEQPRKDNPPDTRSINSLRSFWESKLNEEALCNRAA